MYDKHMLKERFVRTSWKELCNLRILKNAARVALPQIGLDNLWLLRSVTTRDTYCVNEG